MPTGEGVTLIKSFSGNYAEVTTSGELKVSLAAGANITVDISGDAVTTSGNTVALWGASGRNPTYLTNQSGSAPIAVHTPGDGTGGEISLVTIANLMARDPTSFAFNRLATTISGTAASQGGTVFRLLVCNSGDTHQIANGSNVATIAAQGDSAGATTNVFTAAQLSALDPTANTQNRLRSTISGTAASQGGNVFRLLVCNSGDPVSTLVGAATHKTHEIYQITALSGGTRLNGDTNVHKIYLRNMISGGTGNLSGVMFIGSHNFNLPWIETPYSGRGYPLYPSQEFVVENTTPANLRVVTLPTTSGSALGVFMVGL